MAADRYVYDFDETADGGRELLGGKGIGLAELGHLCEADALAAEQLSSSSGRLVEVVDVPIRSHAQIFPQETGIYPRRDLRSASQARARRPSHTGVSKT